MPAGRSSNQEDGSMKKSIVVAVLVAFGAAGCGAGKRTAIGGGVGAAAGAGVGALLGGKRGALIGAGVGALTGGSVGLYLDKQKAELEKVAETKRTEQGLLVNLKNDILFDTGSAVLKDSAVEQLTQVGDILAKYSDDRVRIEGHTDAQGSDSYNEQLSVRRADAVKRVLVSRGVQEKQILVLGLGETKPVADNASADGRSKNRRVELHIDVPKPS
jgi:outer membrane protein OmpA-like peptidoglycan-associated protein